MCCARKCSAPAAEKQRRCHLVQSVATAYVYVCARACCRNGCATVKVAHLSSHAALSYHTVASIQDVVSLLTFPCCSQTCRVFRSVFICPHIETFLLSTSNPTFHPLQIFRISLKEDQCSFLLRHSCSSLISHRQFDHFYISNPHVPLDSMRVRVLE